MSASARHAKALLLALAALTACGGSELPVPVPGSVTPDRGPSGLATPIVIRGTGFVANVVQPASGGTPTVDVTFRAWLGGAALDDVRRIDDTSLSATVPAGLAPGLKSLRVEGPYGTSGELPGAFTVQGSESAALTATIAATPATVTVGQVVTVTLVVQNTGAVGLGDVTPGAPAVSGTATTAPPSGPTP
ncbi:MAG: IPT/TIG domain-containing protein, partial [Anaeromyxobacteraceae bacterium]